MIYFLIDQMKWNAFLQSALDEKLSQGFPSKTQHGHTTHVLSVTQFILSMVSSIKSLKEENLFVKSVIVMKLSLAAMYTVYTICSAQGL